MAALSLSTRKFIRRLSKRGGAPIATIRAEAEQVCHGKSEKTRRRHGKAFIDAAKVHLNEGGSVRARTAVIAALTCDNSLFQLIEKRALLYDPTLGRQPRLQLLDLLGREGAAALDAICPGFGGRLTTYCNLALAQRDLQPAFEHYRELIRTRPPHLLKTLVACADVAFLLPFLPRDHAQALIQQLPAIEARSPEAIAEIVSRIIAEASELAPLKHDNLDAEVAAGLADPVLETVLHLGASRWALGEFQKSAVVLGYDVVKEKEEDGTGTTYVLRPPDMEFERRLRISHATGELARRTGGLHLSRRFSGAMSLTDFAGLYARRLYDAFSRVAESPFPRVVVGLPPAVHASRLFLEKGHFLDDVVESAFQEDLQLRSVDLEEAMLSSSLTVGQYLDLFRMFRLQTALHTGMVLHGAGGNPRLIVNSLLPVLDRKALAGVLDVSGGDSSPDHVNAFINTLTWPPPEASRGGTEHLELQYTPLLRIGDRYLLSPRLVTSANALRNTFSARRARVAGAGDAFNASVADLLQHAFKHVAVERKYDIEGLSGDVDVVVLHGSVLYLFECKHSLPAATTHEHRDLLEDVRKGAAQLIRAQTALPLDAALHNRLKQWFPEAEVGDVQALRFVPCIVTATRMFSGVDVAGVPVRDVFSLENVLLRGSLEMIEAVGAELNIRSYSFWQGEEFSTDDLEDYLRSDGLYWQTRGAHSTDLRVLDASIPPGVALVTETCRVIFESWEESTAKLDGLGLRLLQERREPLAREPAEADGVRASGDQPPEVETAVPSGVDGV